MELVLVEPLADPRAEPGYDLNQKGKDRPSFNTWLVKGHRLKSGRGGGLGGRGGEPFKEHQSYDKDRIKTKGDLPTVKRKYISYPNALGAVLENNGHHAY